MELFIYVYVRIKWIFLSEWNFSFFAMNIFKMDEIILSLVEIIGDETHFPSFILINEIFIRLKKFNKKKCHLKIFIIHLKENMYSYDDLN